MSLAFPLTIIFAALGSIVVQQVVRRFLYQSTTVGCAVGIIAFPILIFLGFPCVIWFGTSHASDLTFEQASHGSTCHFPQRHRILPFTNIFTRFVKSILRSKKLTFLAWCTANEWSPQTNRFRSSIQDYRHLLAPSWTTRLYSMDTKPWLFQRPGTSAAS